MKEEKNKKEIRKCCTIILDISESNACPIQVFNHLEEPMQYKQRDKFVQQCNKEFNNLISERWQIESEENLVQKYLLSLNPQN